MRLGGLRLLLRGRSGLGLLTGLRLRLGALVQRRMDVVFLLLRLDGRSEANGRPLLFGFLWRTSVRLRALFIRRGVVVLLAWRREGFVAFASRRLLRLIRRTIVLRVRPLIILRVVGACVLFRVVGARLIFGIELAAVVCIDLRPHVAYGRGRSEARGDR